jgi:putative transposase
VCGVSTRRVDQLVESLGLRTSRSEVSLSRRQGRKVRDGGRVVPKCVVVAHAVHETGRREIIDVGEAETEAFWREFLRSLVARAA